MVRRNGNNERADAMNADRLDQEPRLEPTSVEFQEVPRTLVVASPDVEEACPQAALGTAGGDPFDGCSEAEVRSELEGGRPAKRIPELLSYLVQQRLQGKTSITEYAIAQDVFEKEEDFAPEEDNSVRVAINRLRNHLKTGYEKRASAVQIHIPPGGYCPVFSRQLRAAAAVPEAEALRPPLAPPLARKTPTATPLSEARPVWAGLSTSYRRKSVLAVVLLVAVAGAALTYVWQHHKSFVGVAPVRFLVFRVLESTGSVATTTVINAVLNATRKYGEAVIIEDQHAFDATSRDAALRASAAARASIAVWGQVIGQNGGTTSIHFAVLDARAALPTLEEVHEYPFRGADNRIALDLRVLCALSIGLSRFETHQYEAAIAAFSDVLAYAASEVEVPIDLGIPQFYRGLAQQAFLQTADVQGNPDGALTRVRHEIDDFTAVLERHTTHAGSYWNRGLAGC
jgi:hypothetical protein